MNSNSLKLLCLISIWPAYAWAQEKPYQDFSADVELEERFFFNEGLYEGQKQNYLSIALRPEYFVEWNNGRSSFKMSLFGRYDQHDENRTHADIRELYWRMVRDNKELSVGLKEVFWGVTESAHIVNVINQTDIVESFDGEAKLGQPMVHYSVVKPYGTFDAFVMPYFRTPTFPGENGRLRTPFLIDADDIEFESDMEEFHPDLAFRWSHFFGVFDIGISHFYGTSRQPLIKEGEAFELEFALVNQTGLDLQATTGPVLWKLEAIYNSNGIKDYTALAAGFEYTFGNVSGKGLDIGLLGEYLYDSRDELAFNSLQNDVFTGVRLAFNDMSDSQLLAGAIFDLHEGSRLISVEGSRRFGETWTVELEGRFFKNVSDKEFVHFMRRDSFLRLVVSKYF
ncbi:hypothetical protein [Fulvivirga imtechensis]|nr:hypothetical protein [Fulvivirga imtechensis]